MIFTNPPYSGMAKWQPKDDHDKWFVAHEFWSGMGRELQYDLRCDQNVLCLKTCLTIGKTGGIQTRYTLELFVRNTNFPVFYVNISNASRIFRFLVFGPDWQDWDELHGIEMDKGTMWALLMDGQQQGIGQNWLLYLHKGNWNGEQVLDESWVNTGKPTNTSEGKYGAILAECGREVPWCSREMYYCSVFKDRWWLLFHHLLVVRMGLKEDLNLTLTECWGRLGV
jgi:hypothetical protein